MRIKGITYDTGFISAGTTTREPFDLEVVKREMEIIRHDLHCNAVRLTGGYPDRLEIAAGFAGDAGLEIWFSPFTNELTLDQLLEVTGDCAERAERLRQRGATVVLVMGAELSLFSAGFVPGATYIERLNALQTPGPQRAELIVNMRRRINEFLGCAAALVRERFGGKVTYASIAFEGVDWTPFDFISVDCYRTREIAAQFRAGIRALVAQDKPVAITECGCVTFRGASEKGARGGMIVQYGEDGRAKQLDADDYIRDEDEQAAEIVDLVEIFREEGVDSVFVNTFGSYFLPHREEPRDDLDLASAGIVKILEHKRGKAYPEMPWEPKVAFTALSECYGS
ncbi:MAG TPA: hypothetical protein VKU01_04910 [Bryobacteraceae bacterium]|nr:hypothetical protein [Bryobacteraceae bacterium]